MPTTDRRLNPAEHPTVFQKLLEPVDALSRSKANSAKTPQEKYTYEAFFGCDLLLCQLLEEPETAG